MSLALVSTVISLEASLVTLFPAASVLTTFTSTELSATRSDVATSTEYVPSASTLVV